MQIDVGETNAEVEYGAAARICAVGARASGRANGSANPKGNPPRDDHPIR